jgi:hypothetical protein
MRTKARRHLGTALVALALAACGGGGDDAQYTVGGSITGYTGRDLTLQLNGGERITLVAGATAFTFSARVAGGSPYAVTIATPPYGLDCTLTRASGTVGNANVGDVAVACGAIAPLALASTTPADNGADVPRAVRPRLTFSHAIDPASINDTSLHLLPEFAAGAVSFDLPSRVSFDIAGPAVTMSPLQRLLPMTRYRVFAGAGVRGVRGQQLPADTSSSFAFTTADGAWQPATAQPTFAAFNDVQGQTVMNGNGQAIAFGRGAADAAVVYHLDAATGAWGHPITLDLPRTLRPLSVAIDEAGNAILLSLTVNTGEGNAAVVVASYNAAAGTWSAAQTISEPVVAEAQPALAVLPDGSVAVAYVTGNTGEERRIVTRTKAGILAGAWTNVPDDHVVAPDPSIFFREMKLAAGGSRTRPVALLTWSQAYNGTSAAVWARRLCAGAYDGAARDISFNDGSLESEPSAVFDRFGRAYVVWAQTTGPFRAVWLRRHDGAAWQPVEVVAAAQDGNAYDPRIASSASAEVNVVAIAWTQLTGGPNPFPRVWTTRIADNGGRSPRRQLVSSTLVPAQAAEIGLDRAGNALVVWSEANGRQLLGRRFDAEQGL